MGNSGDLSYSNNDRLPVFDGNARKAMEYYKQCLDATLEVTTFGEGACGRGESRDRVLHARLTKGSSLLMASDIMPGKPFGTGDGFAIALSCESMTEINSYLTLSARVVRAMPLADMPRGHFGMLTDKFGNRVDAELEKSSRQ
jgi:PhnB protein